MTVGNPGPAPEAALGHSSPGCPLVLGVILSAAKDLFLTLAWVPRPRQSVDAVLLRLRGVLPEDLLQRQREQFRIR